MGYSVTVYESLPVLGGMMRIGIPAYRLPRDILDAQINYISDMGVEFETGITVGADISIEELCRRYGAVFFAIGSQQSKQVKVEGIGLDGVMAGLDFLRDVNLGKKAEVNEKIVVIGGGNVAVNVSLTALRLGAKEVRIVCLESREDMPAFEEEILQAIDEGITIHAGMAPKRILGKDGKVAGIEIMPCIQVFDKTGAFDPVYDETGTTSFEAEQVIFAIGQYTDLAFIPENMKLTQKGLVEADPVTLETSMEGVFAGGDIVQPQDASVVKAIATGKRAAESIDRYLKGKDMKTGRDIHTRVRHSPKDGVPHFPRQATSPLPVAERVDNFREVKAGFTDDKARLEAQRCMTCGSKADITYPEDCMVCLYCERDCPVQAIYVSPDRLARRLAPWDLA